MIRAMLAGLARTIEPPHRHDRDALMPDSTPESFFARIAGWFRRRRPPVPTIDHPDFGPMSFDAEDNTWETTDDTRIYHGGIPGDVTGPDPERVAEVLRRLADVDTWWRLCAEDLLHIAAQYESLPKTDDPRTLFRVAALSLYPGWWEICFETDPPDKWLYVGMQFEGDTLVSNTIDT